MHDSSLLTTVLSGERIEVRNPRSGQVDYAFNAPSETELAVKLGELRSAQQRWRARRR